MSRLQTIVYSIAQVIVEYGELQKVKTEPLKTLLKKSHLDFIEALQTIINDATKVYEDRLSLLNYLLFEIKLLKPLVEQPTLGLEESELIKQELQSFILTIYKLIKTSKSEKISVNYDNEKVEIPGFIRGFTEGYYPCASGQIIKEKFVKPLLLQDHEESTVKRFVENLVTAHQREITIPNENISLKEELVRLTQKIEELERNNSILGSENKQLGKEKEQLFLEKEQLITEKKESWEAQQALLAQVSDLESEMTALRKEMAVLRVKGMTKPTNVRPYPFFGVVPTGLATLLPSTDERNSSPTFGFSSLTDE